MVLVKNLAKQLGIEEERIRVEWISSAQAKKLVAVTKEMVEQLKYLPPNELKKEVTPLEAKH
jgi:F420-non-reducing hydrogenase iron-sulfur subunit